MFDTERSDENAQHIHGTKPGALDLAVSWSWTLLMRRVHVAKVPLVWLRPIEHRPRLLGSWSHATPMYSPLAKAAWNVHLLVVQNLLCTW